jgi:hypothetical protein
MNEFEKWLLNPKAIQNNIDKSTEDLFYDVYLRDKAIDGMYLVEDDKILLYTNLFSR